MGGTCVTMASPPNVPITNQTPGDCLSVVCDGKGGETSIPADNPAADLGDCTIQGCADGKATVANAMDGAPCSVQNGAICEGGACVCDPSKQQACAFWSERFGDAASQGLHGDIVADSLGNVIVTGELSGTLSLGGQCAPLTSNGMNGSVDVFLAKLDDTGKCLWSKRFGDSHTFVGGLELAVNAAGDIFLAGTIGSGAIDFGGGAVSTGMTAMDAFVVKLDTNGTFGWGKHYYDPMGKVTTASDIAVDKFGNVLVTGSFFDTASFGPFTPTSVGDSDVYVVKLDPSGTLTWMTTFGDSAKQVARHIAASPIGEVIVFGYYLGSMTLPNGQPITCGGQCLYLGKIDATGQSALWTKSFGDAFVDGASVASGLAVDKTGAIILSGAFSGGPVSYGGAQLLSNGQTDVSLAKLDKDGNHLWSKSFGDGDIQSELRVATDSAGNVFLAGGYMGMTLDFGGGPLVLRR